MEQQTLRQILDPSPIKKTELFASLLDREVNYVAERSSVIHLRKKARLFSIGQKADHFYMLIEGSIRVFKPRDDGGSDEMAQYAPGDTIGDFDFARKAEYDANAEASEESVLIMFPAMGLEMEDFAAEEPHIVSRILLNSIIMMTNRIKSTQKILLENLSWVNELHRRAYEDPGTGLWKQAFLADEINRVLEVPTALVMLKPDRFKILVDSRGHAAGDEAMVRIAMILKNITRRIGRGWPLRFKSNETGLLINKCGVSPAETLVKELSRAIASLDPVPEQGDIPPFSFSGTIAYAVWPEDGRNWDKLFGGCYSLLLDTWKQGGGKIVRYRVPEDEKEAR
ncbi:MAG: cyclic nucleotide-binding domain-containing protein [Treponema sp.]|nr:cyclic nucleotide-binding domain-containing protein [Treponema sp.]